MIVQMMAEMCSNLVPRDARDVWEGWIIWEPAVWRGTYNQIAELYVPIEVCPYMVSKPSEKAGTPDFYNEGFMFFRMET